MGECKTPGCCTCPGMTRCPACGYTDHDKASLMDHKFCESRKYTIHVTNESGDDLGRHSFPEKPDSRLLKAYLMNLSPEDWDGGHGPGEFGSYLHVEVVEASNG